MISDASRQVMASDATPAQKSAIEAFGWAVLAMRGRHYLEQVRSGLPTIPPDDDCGLIAEMVSEFDRLVSARLASRE